MPSFVEPVKETGRLNLKDRFGNKAHVDYEIRSGENPAVSIARAIEQKGGKCTLEFDEKLGKHYIKEITLGEVHLDGFIQFYDKNQRMLCRVGKDGDVLWENLDSIDLTKHRILNLQDDVGMTQELRDPLEELALRSGAMQYQRRGGGGGDHREEMSRDQIEKLERETVFSISVDPNTYEIFDESGKKITKFDDLIFKMHEQLANIGMPIMPKAAEPAFNAQLTDALSAIIPKEVIYALENKNPAQMLDGFPVSIAVTLQMVAIKFDAFDRYGISVAACSTLQNMQANERVEMEVKNSIAQPIPTSPTTQIKTADHFYVDLPVYSRMRTEKIQNPKDEENPIIRMIMNPTERRLWGRLFGFPDEEQVQTIVGTEQKMERQLPQKPSIILREIEQKDVNEHKKETSEKKQNPEKEAKTNKKQRKDDPKDSKKKDERKEKEKGSDEDKKPGGGKAAKKKKPEKEELTAKKEEKLREAKLNALQGKERKKQEKTKAPMEKQEQEAIHEKRKKRKKERTRKTEEQIKTEPGLTKQKRIKQTEKKEKTKLEKFPEKKKYGTKKAIANDSKKPKSTSVKLVVPENTKTRSEGKKIKQKEHKLAEKTELKTTKKIRAKQELQRKQELIKQSRKPEQQKSKTSKKEKKKSKKMSSFVLNWILTRKKRKGTRKKA